MLRRVGIRVGHPDCNASGCSASPAMRGRAGFTLIELLVVMAIAGILMVAFATEFEKWRTKYKTESDTKMLYSIMLETKIAALKDHSYYFITLPAEEPNAIRVYKDTFPDVGPKGNGTLQIGEDKLIKEEYFTLTPDLLPDYRLFWFTAQGYLRHGKDHIDNERDFQIAMTEHDTIKGVEGWYTAFGDYNCLLITPPLYFGGGMWNATQTEESLNASLKNREVVIDEEPACIVK